jgi:hypothetical protein
MAGVTSARIIPREIALDRRARAPSPDDPKHSFSLLERMDAGDEQAVAAAFPRKEQQSVEERQVWLVTRPVTADFHCVGVGKSRNLIHLHRPSAPPAVATHEIPWGRSLGAQHPKEIAPFGGDPSESRQDAYPAGKSHGLATTSVYCASSISDISLSDTEARGMRTSAISPSANRWYEVTVPVHRR